MEKIVIDIEAKTGAATEDVKKFAKSIQDANKETTKLTETTEDNAKSTGILQEKWNGVKESFKGLSNSFKGAYQGLVGVAKGFGLSAKASKGLAIGLSALGLPLILMAVSALVEYFKNFEAGVKFLDKAMASLGAVVGQLAAGFKALLSGDFSEAADAFKNIGSAAVDAAGQIDKLYEANKRLNDLQVEFATVNAELVANIERNRKIIEDETQTYEDRAEALKKVNADTLQLAENEKKVSEERLKSLKAQLAVENNFEKQRELELQIAEEQAALIAKNSAIETIVFDGNKKLRELDQRRSEAEKAQSEKRIEQSKAEQEKKAALRKSYEEKLKALSEENELKEIEDINARALRKLEIERANQIASLEQAGYNEEQKRELIKAINKKYDLLDKETKDQQKADADEKKKAADEKSEEERLKKRDVDLQIAKEEEELRQKKLQGQIDTLNTVVALAGEETKMGKAALIAKQLLAAKEMLIDMGIIKQKAVKTIATAQMDVASSGTAIATGVAQTAKIGFPQNIPALIAYAATAAGIVGSIASAFNSTKSAASKFGGGSGSGSAPNLTTAAVSTPPSFNVVGSSNSNQIADAIAASTQSSKTAPVKAYVVSNDVTTAQSLDRNIVNSASI